MKRVASLYFPNLAIDRLRRIEGGAKRDERLEGSPSRSAGTTTEKRLSTSLETNGPIPKEGARIEDCSCPRGGGWRPGARWAREDVEAQVESLPLHQRPRIQELGRRTEAAEVPFRGGRGDAPPIRSLRAKSISSSEHSHGVSTSLDTNGIFEAPPLVTTHRSGQRITIAAASPAAISIGLQPGMAVTQARAMVPGLELREAAPEGDAAFLARLGLFAARRWTPAVAVSGADGLWLDIKGASHLFGGERRMCARILRFCARLGFAARIAVAGTPGAAHALARCSPDPVTLCPSGGEAEAIAPLPISALRLEEDVLGAARRLGLDRIGDLLSMPRGPLQRRFGRTMLMRLDQALGWAAEPFDPIVPQEPPSASASFAEPIAGAEAIEQAVRDLIAELIRSLEKAGLAVRRLILLCDRIDGDRQGIAIGTARATRDAAHLLRLLLMKVETIEPGFGIEAMRLVASRAEPLGAEPVPSALAGEKPAPDIVPLIDRLAGRLGARRLFRTSAVESDVPERSLRRISPLGHPTSWPRDWPRPVRLLSPPERVENVVALLPDHPPRRFTWRGRSYAVTRGDGPERIHGEWWKSSGEADAVRDYYHVEDEEGARFWLYRRGDGVDARTGDLSWYLHGLFG